MCERIRQCERMCVSVYFHVRQCEFELVRVSVSLRVCFVCTSVSRKDEMGRERKGGYISPCTCSDRPHVCYHVYLIM